MGPSEPCDGLVGECQHASISVLGWRIAILAGVFAFVLVTGCSNSVESQVAAMNDSHIKQVANLYYGYRAATAAHLQAVRRD